MIKAKEPSSPHKIHDAEKTKKGHYKRPHFSWNSLRHPFGGKPKKPPGYIEGPWFPQPEPVNETKSGTVVGEKDRAAGDVKIKASTSSSRLSHPGRIQGPWFDKSSGDKQNYETTISSSSINSSSANRVNDEEKETPRATSSLAHMGPASSPSDTLPPCPYPSVTTHTPGPLLPKKSCIFTRMTTIFPDVTIDPEFRISTPLFLQACSSMLTILDLMGDKVFHPVKADLNGNINKLRSHYEGDEVKRGTLQEMILEETEGGAKTGFATEGLLWLKRSLQFVDEFLVELLKTEDETRECAHRAYKQSLECFHNFVIRTAFQVAVYTLPNRKDFIAKLSDKKEHVNDPAYVESLMQQAREYSVALKRIVEILNKFYLDNGLETCAVP